MTYPQSAPDAVALDAARSRTWSAVAIAAAAAIIGLEGWDAFHISHPQGAVIAMVLFAAGIAWLSRRGGRAPAIFLGVFFALELILNFTIFGVLGDLQHQGSWTDFSTGLGYTAASLAGLSACLALTAARPREDRNAGS
jgi:FtsH-binding integral membrane protein